VAGFDNWALVSRLALDDVSWSLDLLWAAMRAQEGVRGPIAAA
jgi:hypothetical protein